MKELFKIVTDEKDDLEYISLVNWLISSTFMKKPYETVSIIKVKNWFDHKWLNYSGKEVVRFESGGLCNNDLAIENIWKKQITFPPFNPNRIIDSRTYPINREIKSNDIKPIHIYQVSGQNLQNRIALKQENSLYAWFSSNSKVNQKGSLMVYELFNNVVQTWYCQIEYNKGWNIGKTKNTSAITLRNSIR